MILLGDEGFWSGERRYRFVVLVPCLIVSCVLVHWRREYEVQLKVRVITPRTSSSNCCSCDVLWFLEIQRFDQKGYND